MSSPAAFLPGSQAARAHTWLLADPARDKTPTAVLADAIGVDAADLTAALSHARSRGWFTTEKRPDGPGVVWSASRPADPPADPDPPRALAAPFNTKAPEPAPFRAGVFTDGTLLIQKGGRDVSLSLPEAQSLLGLIRALETV